MYDYSDRDTKADRARISHSYTEAGRTICPTERGMSST